MIVGPAVLLSDLVGGVELLPTCLEVDYSEYVLHVRLKEARRVG